MTYCHLDDIAEIYREGGRVVVTDCDGHEVLRSKNGYTDNEIREIIGLMNAAYDKGVRLGRAQRSREFRRLLELDNTSLVLLGE